MEWTNLQNKTKTLEMTQFEDFVDVLKDRGFITLSKNAINWINLSDLVPEDRWHTDLPTDPWKWRVRVEEAHLAAYGKLFEKKPGFISLRWYPKFLAARREGKSFQERYEEGSLSHYAKEIYNLFDKHDRLALYEIKALGGFTKELNSKFESAMAELQMGMFITISGTKQKRNQKGEPYGWPATAYQTVELWAGEELIETAGKTDPQEAREEIIAHIKLHAPGADLKKIKKFLGF